MDLKNYVATIENYPKEGIIFRDITPLMNDGEAYKYATEKIVEFAKTQIGKPYVYGATGNNSFDCSSFVQYVIKRTLGITIPRVSAEQSVFKPKLHNNIKKGDLLFFETLGKGRISHVGMYIGNRQFIHASSKSKRVTISDFTGFYQDKFRWAVSVI